MSTTPFRDNFRNNLRALLDRGDLSITDFAKQAGIHRVTVYKILSGKMEPSLSMCEKLAEFAGISPPEKVFQKSRRFVVS